MSTDATRLVVSAVRELPPDSESARQESVHQAMTRQRLVELAEQASRRRFMEACTSGALVLGETAARQVNSFDRPKRGSRKTGSSRGRLLRFCCLVGCAAIGAASGVGVVRLAGVRPAIEARLGGSLQMSPGMQARPALVAAFPGRLGHVGAFAASDLPALAPVQSVPAEVPATTMATPLPWPPGRPVAAPVSAPSATVAPVAAALAQPKTHPDLDGLNFHFTSKPSDPR